jgi:hypothetical protein
VLIKPQGNELSPVVFLALLFHHCICSFLLLALTNFYKLLFLLRLGRGEVELEPAVLPARLEELLGRYPHLPQHQAAVCPVWLEVKPRLPAGPDHRDGRRERPPAVPGLRRLIISVTQLPLARQDLLVLDVVVEIHVAGALGAEALSAEAGLA